MSRELNGIQYEYMYHNRNKSQTLKNNIKSIYEGIQRELLIFLIPGLNIL